jgi:hypothetical protein
MMEMLEDWPVWDYIAGVGKLIEQPQLIPRTAVHMFSSRLKKN